MIKPRHIEKGDTIGIVAPAWSFNRVHFKKGVKQLESLGFKVKYSLDIFKKHWSMAGFDDARAKLINSMFADKNVKAIFCAKAGYGSIRTLPYLDKDIIRSNPKIFVGYSDITILLPFLQDVAGMVVFHGPVICGEIHKNMNPLTLNYLIRAITRPEPLGEITYPGLKSLKPSKAKGVIVGGNISMIVSSIGTPYEIDTRGKILFLEDVGEDLEVIDHYLMHLKLAGKFDEVKGLIFGRMIDCVGYSGERYSIPDIIKDILSDINVPIIYGFPSGHRRPGDLNVTLPLGVPVTLDADNLRLTIEEPCVT